MKKSTIATIIGAGIIVILGIVWLCLPYYAKQALIHLMPVINDLETFHRDTVSAPDSTILWEKASDYNSYKLTAGQEAFMDGYETVSFLVICKDSIVFENYRNGWNDTLTSNIYSCTKSIVSMLAGIALDEGHIKSLDDKVSDYIPQYTKGMQKDVTIRDVLTMSSGMAWDEAYSSLFSLTTHGYYGNDLYDLVTNLEVSEKPGVQYNYRSGITQLLAFIVEAATGETISKYAQEKLWKPLNAERDAYWLLDKENGDEKAFCCFHTTARDVARFGALMLSKGEWKGRRIISEEYMTEALTPASYLLDEWGKDSLNYYGFQFWILNHNGKQYPMMKGMLGQYILAMPEHDAIMVRLGHKRSSVYVRETPDDLFGYIEIAEEILDNRKK